MTDMVSAIGATGRNEANTQIKGVTQVLWRHHVLDSCSCLSGHIGFQSFFPIVIALVNKLSVGEIERSRMASRVSRRRALECKPTGARALCGGRSCAGCRRKVVCG